MASQLNPSTPSQPSAADWLNCVTETIKCIPVIVPVIVLIAKEVQKLFPVDMDEFVSDAANGRFDQIQKVIERVDVNGVNKDGWSGLVKAAANGQIQIVEELLRKGATLDKRVTCGRTALMQASRNGYTYLVNLFLDRSANINMVDNDGWTPLMLAAWQGKTEVVRTLFRRGANANLTNNEGKAARTIAMELGHREIVQILS